MSDTEFTLNINHPNTTFMIQKWEKFILKNPHKFNFSKIILELFDFLKNNSSKIDARCISSKKIYSNELCQILESDPSETEGYKYTNLIKILYFYLIELNYENDDAYFTEPIILIRKIDRYITEEREKIVRQDTHLLESYLKHARSLLLLEVSKQTLQQSEEIHLRNLSAETFEAINKVETLKYEVEKLKEFLSTAKNNLNFTILVESYNKIKRNKQLELAFSYISVTTSIFATLLIPAIQIYNFNTTAASLSQASSLLIYKIALTAALEFILIYLFRIALQNHRSIKAQLLQIDLRICLCQFIENYLSFKDEKATKGHNETLNKFEAIIFSNIMPDGQSIPSTFDGTEQLASLIKSVRGN